MAICAARDSDTAFSFLIFSLLHTMSSKKLKWSDECAQIWNHMYNKNVMAVILNKSYLIFLILKASVNVHMKLVGFATFNKWKHTISLLLCCTLLVLLITTPGLCTAAEERCTFDGGHQSSAAAGWPAAVRERETGQQDRQTDRYTHTHSDTHATVGLSVRYLWSKITAAGVSTLGGWLVGQSAAEIDNHSRASRMVGSWGLTVVKILTLFLWKTAAH